MIAIVNRESLKVVGTYEGELDDTSAKRSWLHAEPICKHVVVPEGLDPRFLLCDTEFNITEDSTALVNSLPTVSELRQAEYNAQGVTIEALTVAIVEATVENRPEALAALQAKREAIKLQFPKE